MHYFLVYKEISELLFQMSNFSYLVSHVLTQHGVAMLRDFRNKCRRVVCAVMHVTVVLD